MNDVERTKRNLENIWAHIHDTQWIKEQEHHIRETFSAAFHWKGKDPDLDKLTIEVLCQVLPILRAHPRYDNWRHILDIPYLEAIKTQDDVLSARSALHIADVYALVGYYGQAYGRVDMTLEKVQSKNPEIELEALTMLIRVETYNRTGILYPQHIRLAHQLARKVNSLHLTAELHQALAKYFTLIGKCEYAEHYARSAYKKWDTLGNRDGKINALISLGYISRWKRDYRNAQKYLVMAKAGISKAVDTLKYAQVVYELGAIEYEQGDCNTTKPLWYEALEAFEFCQNACGIAETSQTLALLNAYQGDFQESQANIERAKTAWSKVNSPLKLLQWELYDGFADGIAKKYASAEEKLKTLLLKLNQEKDSPIRQELKGDATACLKIILEWRDSNNN
jgi:hypothetical protein